MGQNVLIKIEYDGTNFSGWQVQPDARTVQGEIEHVLKRRAERPQLSARQLEVLSYASTGLTSKAIASKMGITADCVNGHLRAIFAHLKAVSRTEAIATAMRLGLIS